MEYYITIYSELYYNETRFNLFSIYLDKGDIMVIHKYKNKNYYNKDLCVLNIRNHRIK